MLTCSLNILSFRLVYSSQPYHELRKGFHANDFSLGDSEEWDRKRYES